MSYRGFKRLLGETSLERKCRIILGSGMFVLVFASFLFYEAQTERLVREQWKIRCDSLLWTILASKHSRELEFPKGADVGPDQSQKPNTLPGAKPTNQNNAKGLPPNDIVSQIIPLDPVKDGKQGSNQKNPALNASQLEAKESRAQLINELMPDRRQFISRYLRDPKLKTSGEQTLPIAIEARYTDEDSKVMDQMRSGKVDTVMRADHRLKYFHYWKAVRLQPSCLRCHPTATDKELHYEKFADDSLHGIMHIELNINPDDTAINVNRAILLTFATATAILAVTFTYVTLRYVIIKPVAHLQQVSDEIAAGNLTTRANIQSGDEFQDLSQAFNRMIRSLVSLQDELKKVNLDLDTKLDELARANMSLFELNRLKSEFLATISHELRTPLNSVMGFSDLLSEQMTEDSKHRRWIENIQTSGRKLMQLINDILDLAKMEAGKMQVDLEHFSLTDLVNELFTLLRPLSDKKNIGLGMDIDLTLPRLHQDRKKLGQILQNLLSNAIKFTPEGGQIWVKARANRSHALISVQDNGIGIAPEDQKLIFEKFRQAESSLTREHAGTGLGLSIVREMTKLLGGDEVMLDSELGRGSTFTINIPITYSEVQQTFKLPVDQDLFQAAKARDAEPRYYEYSNTDHS